MYEFYSPYVKAELDYRRDRMRGRPVPPKSRHHRFPWPRRGAGDAS